MTLTIGDEENDALSNPNERKKDREKKEFGKEEKKRDREREREREREARGGEEIIPRNFYYVILAI